MKKGIFFKSIGILCALCLCLGLIPVTALAANDLQGKTAIIYTANLRGDITVLPQVSALKGEYKDRGADVVLVDTGNFLQGTIYSTYDSGKSVIELMDKAGYDVVAIGSHEFDFGTGQVGVEQHEVYYADGSLGKHLESASFSAVSANIFTGKEALHAFAPSAKVTTASGREIGVFGLTDTGTAGNVLESNISGLSFKDAAAAAAAQVSALESCDLVVGLSNVGLISPLDGAVLIDVASSAGFTVGLVLIDNSTGKIESSSTISLDGKSGNSTVEAAVNAVKSAVDAIYPASSVVKSNVTLNGSMAASRSKETNTGDLWTDALLWFANDGGISDYYDEDEIANGNTGISVDRDKVVAIWNGGNLRDYLNTGDVTMKDIQRVLPYPNRVAVVYLTGAQLLEMLESATQALPYSAGSSAASASFAQVAGLTYSVATGIPYDAGAKYGSLWYRANSIRRVTITDVNGKAFDASAVYAVITSNAIANGMDSNYISHEKDADLSTITTATVVDVVWMYINQKLDGVIGSEYASPQNRITIDTSVNFPDVTADSAYYDDIVYAVKNGLISGTGVDSFEPSLEITRGAFVSLLYSFAGSPSVDADHPFEDVSEDSAYYNAVAWAYETGKTSGTSATSFSPDKPVTRAELATFIYNYFGKPNVTSEAGFSDLSSIAAWALDGAVFSTESGYVDLSGAAFEPAGLATRAAIAKALSAMHTLHRSQA